MPVKQASRLVKNNLFNPANAATSDELVEMARLRLTLSLVRNCFFVGENYLLGPSRGRRRLVLARHLVQYLAHVTFGINFTNIARRTRRDRTSVTHACSRIEDARNGCDFDKAVFFLEFALSHMAERTMEHAHDADG